MSARILILQFKELAIIDCRSIKYYGKTRVDRLPRRYKEHAERRGGAEGRCDKLTMIALTNSAPDFVANGYRSSEHKAAVGEFLL